MLALNKTYIYNIYTYRTVSKLTKIVKAEETLFRIEVSVSSATMSTDNFVNT